jgi:Tol biopolymer transport system component
MSWIGSQVYFGTQTAIMTAPAAGGTVTEMVKADTSKEERVGHPWATSDGKHLIFAVNTKSWETSQIVAQDLASGERRVLVPGGTSPRLLTSGYLIFYRDSTIFAQRFDETTAAVSGVPVPMVQSVGYSGFTGAGQFSVADSGTVVYVEGSSAALLSMMWVDRTGKTQAVPGAPARRYIGPRLSPDGTRVAVATQDESPDIFVWDLNRGTETRVTNDETRDTSPMWLDNRELLFATARSGDPGGWI